MKKYLFVMAVSIGVILIMRISVVEETSAFYKIVRDMGYKDAETVPFETVDFTLPEKFTAVYEKYNKLQKEGGYDLSLYKGKKCIRYTYRIPSVNARANVIVCGGKIIGGDICSITLDGIMLPLKNPEKVDAQH